MKKFQITITASARGSVDRQTYEVEEVWSIPAIKAALREYNSEMTFEQCVNDYEILGVDVVQIWRP